jgi:hypothetical protein
VKLGATLKRRAPTDAQLYIEEEGDARTLFI